MSIHCKFGGCGSLLALILSGLALIPFSLTYAQLHHTYTEQIPLTSTADSCNLTPSNPTSFWLEQIKHEGTSPFIPNGANWRVFRNVKDYGAKGDGQTDDTQAIQAAINDGNRESHHHGRSSMHLCLPFVVESPKSHKVSLKRGNSEPLRAPEQNNNNTGISIHHDKMSTMASHCRDPIVRIACAFH